SRLREIAQNYILVGVKTAKELLYLNRTKTGLHCVYKFTCSVITRQFIEYVSELRVQYYKYKF
ncbi:hypothetical protein L9F63_023238, partial [Diploptera punctata]